VTKDERQKLREAALVAFNSTRARSDVRRAALAGDWALQTSNSFRRIGAHGDGDVLCATTHQYDRHPDLLAPSGVLDYIIAVQPGVVLGLLDYIDAIESRLDRLDEIEPQLIKMREAVEKALREVFR
jgi:hypothetical protein